MKILEQIKNFMNDNNITQKYLAHEMGVSTAAPCYWFKGKRIPNLKDVEKMIDILGLEIIVMEKKS